jgi:hypothetical protein
LSPVIDVALINRLSSARVIQKSFVVKSWWFKDWLRGYIEREANLYVNGQISIERLGGNLFSGIELENIGLSMDGTQVAVVKDLGLDFNVFEPISKGLSVKHIRLNQPVLYLRREGDAWSISRLVKKQRQEANRGLSWRPGEGWRQNPVSPVESVTYRFQTASVVANARAAGPCASLPKGCEGCRWNLPLRAGCGELPSVSRCRGDARMP